MICESPFDFFRAPSGLGQGLGYALGIKLALPKRTVVVTIGDGTFLYNPVIPHFAFADEHKLPLLILVFNNAKYAAMQYYHDKFYPAGTAIATKDYYGVELKGVKYEQAAAMVDGYSRRVETPGRVENSAERGAQIIGFGQKRDHQHDHAGQGAVTCAVHLDAGAAHYVAPDVDLARHELRELPRACCRRARRRAA